MAVEKISLYDIEKFKLDEEFREIDEEIWPGAEENLAGDWAGVNMVVEGENGEQQDVLFVPSSDGDEIKDELMKRAALDSLPELTKEYIEAEVARTGESAEDIIKDYIAMVEQIMQNGKIED